MSDPIVFYASFPTNAIAIRMHGDGGYRITLDLSESEEDAIDALKRMRGKTMVMTAQVEERDLTGLDDETEKDTKRSPVRLDRRRTPNR